MTYEKILENTKRISTTSKFISSSSNIHIFVRSMNKLKIKFLFKKRVSQIKQKLQHVSTIIKLVS